MNENKTTMAKADTTPNSEVGTHYGEAMATGNPTATQTIELAARRARKKSELENLEKDHNYQIGRKNERRGDWKAAVKFYALMLKDHPDNCSAHAILAAALAGLKQWDRAIEESTKALQLNPADVTARANLGAVFANRGEEERAIEELKLALSFDPDYEIAKNYLHVLLCRRRSEGEERKTNMADKSKFQIVPVKDGDIKVICSFCAEVHTATIVAQENRLGILRDSEGNWYGILQDEELAAACEIGYEVDILHAPEPVDPPTDSPSVVLAGNAQ